MSKIKVLICLPNFSGGGGERTVVNLLQTIDRTVFDVKCVISTYEGAYLDRVASQDILFSPHADKSFSIKNISLLAALKFFKQTLQNQHYALGQFKPNIILTVTDSMSLIGYLWYLLGKFRPCIWIIRSGNHVGQEMKFQYKNTVVYMTMKNLMKAMFSSANLVIGISDGVKAHLISLFKLPTNHVHRIYNPIDLNHIATQRHIKPTLKLDKPYLLGIGRLVHQKRFDVLIDGYAKSDAPNHNIDLCIIGEGPLLPALTRQVQTLGLSERVHFLGFQDNPYTLLSSSVGFVLTSAWEGFAHVVCEALACETPVIVSDCGFGPAEIVGENNCGIIVPVGDVNKLAKAITKLLNDHDYRTTLISNGNKRITDFALQAITTKYERLFLSCARK